MSRVFVDNIDEGAHTADFRCSNGDWTDEGVNVDTDAQCKYAESVPDLTINGNITASVADVAALPDATGLAANVIYHVLADDEDGTISAGGANLYYVVDDGGKAWVRINGNVVVTCPTCGLTSSYPMYDPRNICGMSLGKAKTA